MMFYTGFVNLLAFPAKIPRYVQLSRQFRGAPQPPPWLRELSNFCSCITPPPRTWVSKTPATPLHRNLTQS